MFILELSLKQNNMTWHCLAHNTVLSNFRPFSIINSELTYFAILNANELLNDSFIICCLGRGGSHLMTRV